MRIFTNTTLAAFLIAGCGSIAAYADTITFQGSPSIPYTNANNGFAQSVSLHQFDSSLGTLTGIELDMNAEFQVVLSVHNPTGSPIDFTGAYGSGYVEVLGPNNLDVFLQGDTGLQSGTVAGGATFTSSSLPATISGSTFPTDLADFIGSASSTIALTFQADGFGAGGSTPVVGYSATGNAGGNLDVIYTYTAAAPSGVPEPASWLLMGSSLLVAGFLFRKRLAL